jgi:hypothetical protein
MNLNRSTLHHVIIRTFIDCGYPPTVSQLASKFGASTDSIVEALIDLQDYHGVVLHPGSHEIWIAHPFSAAPTAHIVRNKGREWWGCCAWCALGVATLIGGTANIHTIIGNTVQSPTIRIANGKLIDKDYVVHFPVKMANAWDNVHYTCSMMLFFPNENDIDEWCTRHNVTKGDVRSIEQVWNFSKEWYGSHANQNWKKWTIDEAIDLFRRHGLDGPIWVLEGDAEHF